MSDSIQRTTTPTAPVAPSPPDFADRTVSSPSNALNRRVKAEEGGKQRGTAWTQFKNFFDITEKFQALRTRRANVVVRSKGVPVPSKAQLAPDAQSVRTMLKKRTDRYARGSLQLNGDGKRLYCKVLSHVTAVLEEHTDQTALTPKQRADVGFSLEQMDALFNTKGAKDLAKFRRTYPSASPSSQLLPFKQEIPSTQAQEALTKIQNRCEQNGKPTDPDYTPKLIQSEFIVNHNIKIQNKISLLSQEGVKSLFSNLSVMLDIAGVEGEERNELLKDFLMPPASPLPPNSANKAKAEFSPRGLLHRKAREGQETKQRISTWTQFKNFFDLKGKFKAFRTRRAQTEAKNYAIPREERLTPDARHARTLLQSRIDHYAPDYLKLSKPDQFLYKMAANDIIFTLKQNIGKTELTPLQKCEVMSAFEQMDDLFAIKDPQDLDDFRTLYDIPESMAILRIRANQLAEQAELSPPPSPSPEPKSLSKDMSINKARGTIARIAGRCERDGEPDNASYTNMLETARSITGIGTTLDDHRPLSLQEMNQLHTSLEMMLVLMGVGGQERGELLEVLFED